MKHLLKIGKDRFINAQAVSGRARYQKQDLHEADDIWVAIVPFWAGDNFELEGTRAQVARFCKKVNAFLDKFVAD